MHDLREHLRRCGARPAVGASTGDVLAFVRSALDGTAPPPGPMALQVPPGFGGRPLVTREFVAHAHAHDIVVHVWTINEPAEIAPALRSRRRRRDVRLPGTRREGGRRACRARLTTLRRSSSRSASDCARRARSVPVSISPADAAATRSSRRARACSVVALDRDASLLRKLAAQATRRATRDPRAARRRRVAARAALPARALRCRRGDALPVPPARASARGAPRAGWAAGLRDLHRTAEGTRPWPQQSSVFAGAGGAADGSSRDLEVVESVEGLVETGTSRARLAGGAGRAQRSLMDLAARLARYAGRAVARAIPPGESSERPARVFGEQRVLARGVSLDQRDQRRDRPRCPPRRARCARGRGTSCGAARCAACARATRPRRARAATRASARPIRRAARARARRPPRRAGSRVAIASSTDTRPGRCRSRRPRSPCAARSGSGIAPRSSIVVYERQRVASST